jgi:hypothetical protein
VRRLESSALIAISSHSDRIERSKLNFTASE